MRKRQQAPGDLELVRAFVNTREVDTGTDELVHPAELHDWLLNRGLASGQFAVTTAQHRRALALREALRAALISHTERTPVAPEARQTLEDAATRARLRLRFDEGGDATIEPSVGGVDGALGRLLTFVHAAIADGTWTRLKACREHTCEWAFYDHTKNRSGTWCTMEVCGNRAKARSYRERQSRVEPQARGRAAPGHTGRGARGHTGRGASGHTGRGASGHTGRGASGHT